MFSSLQVSISTNNAHLMHPYIFTFVEENQNLLRMHIVNTFININFVHKIKIADKFHSSVTWEQFSHDSDEHCIDYVRNVRKIKYIFCLKYLHKFVNDINGLSKLTHVTFYAIDFLEIVIHNSILSGRDYVLCEQPVY